MPHVLVHYRTESPHVLPIRTLRGNLHKSRSFEDSGGDVLVLNVRVQVKAPSNLADSIPGANSRRRGPCQAYVRSQQPLNCYMPLMTFSVRYPLNIRTRMSANTPFDNQIIHNPILTNLHVWLKPNDHASQASKGLERHQSEMSTRRAGRVG